jgi:serralysin
VRLLSFFVALLLALPGAALPGSALASQPTAPPPPTLFRTPDGRVAELDDARLPADAPALAAEALQASGDYRIDGLLSGYNWPSGWTTLTYSFYEDDVFAGSYYGYAPDAREVSEAVKANIRQIMAWYSTIINVNFVEVTETPSQIGYLRFLLTGQATYARAYYPTSTTLFHVSGDVHLNPSYDRLGDTNGFQHPAGEHGYFTLIHEVGHALGLEHPFENYPTLPALEDNDSHTVMTYTWLGDSAATTMPYDFLALQYLYGAHARWDTDDVYAFTTRGADQYARAGSILPDTPYRVKQTLWDTGGANTLDLTLLPSAQGGYRVDLRELGWISAMTDYGGDDFSFFRTGTALGPGVRIARVIGSASSDTIYAGSGPTAFAGYGPGRASGADVIVGATAEDTLDLRAFGANEVSRTRVGDDLVLTLGGDGSVTLRGYYSGNTPAILLGAAQVYLPLIAR